MDGETSPMEIDPALAEITDALADGDIEHHCAMVALESLFENWTGLIKDGAAGEDSETSAINLMDQFDRLAGMLKTLRPQVAAALAVATQPINAPSA